MKLAEILARELKAWPVDDSFPLSQAVTGKLYVSCTVQGNEDAETLFTEIRLELAEDWMQAEVTRAQWEAERARIVNLELTSAFSQEQEISESQREKIAKEWWEKQMQGQPLMVMDIPSPITKNYEQELWDRVAQGWIAGASADAQCSWSTSATQGHVEIACDVADAFMAERAKRLKGGA